MSQLPVVAGNAGVAERCAALLGAPQDAVLAAAPGECDPATAVEIWLHKIDGAEGELRTLKDVCEGKADLAKLSVALRTLRAMLA